MSYIEKNGKPLKRQHYPGIADAERQRSVRKKEESDFSHKEPEDIKDYEKWLVVNNID